MHYTYIERTEPTIEEELDRYVNMLIADYDRWRDLRFDDYLWSGHDKILRHAEWLNCPRMILGEAQVKFRQMMKKYSPYKKDIQIGLFNTEQLEK